jgi:hypothetical protein
MTLGAVVSGDFLNEFIKKGTRGISTSFALYINI